MPRRQRTAPAGFTGRAIASYIKTIQEQIGKALTAEDARVLIFHADAL